MKSIFTLLISGDTFFFEDTGFTIDQKKKLEELAKQSLKINPELKSMNESEVKSWFMDFAKDNLEIILNNLTVSFIIRINK